MESSNSIPDCLLSDDSEHLSQINYDLLSDTEQSVPNYSSEISSVLSENGSSTTTNVCFGQDTMDFTNERPIGTSPGIQCVRRVLGENTENYLPIPPTYVTKFDTTRKSTNIFENSIPAPTTPEFRSSLGQRISMPTHLLSENISSDNSLGFDVSAIDPVSANNSEFIQPRRNVPRKSAFNIRGKNETIPCDETFNMDSLTNTSVSPQHSTGSNKQTDVETTVSNDQSEVNSESLRSSENNFSAENSKKSKCPKVSQQPRKSAFHKNYSTSGESDIDMTFSKSIDVTKLKDASRARNFNNDSNIDSSDMSSFEKSKSFVQKQPKKSIFIRPIERDSEGASSGVSNNSSLEKIKSSVQKHPKKSVCTNDSHGTSLDDSDISSFEKSKSFVHKQPKKSICPRQVTNEYHDTSLDVSDFEKTKSSQEYAKPRKTLCPRSLNTSASLLDISDFDKTNIEKDLTADSNNETPETNSNAEDAMQECEQDMSSHSVTEEKEQTSASNIEILEEILNANEIMEKCDQDVSNDSVNEEKEQSTASNIEILKETLNAEDAVETCEQDHSSDSVNEEKEQTSASNIEILEKTLNADEIIEETMNAQDAVETCEQDHSNDSVNEEKEQTSASNIEILEETLMNVMEECDQNNSNDYVNEEKEQSNASNVEIVEDSNANEIMEECEEANSIDIVNEEKEQSSTSYIKILEETLNAEDAMEESQQDNINDSELMNAQEPNHETFELTSSNLTLAKSKLSMAFGRISNIPSIKDETNIQDNINDSELMNAQEPNHETFELTSTNLTLSKSKLSMAFGRLSNIPSIKDQTNTDLPSGFDTSSTAHSGIHEPTNNAPKKSAFNNREATPSDETFNIESSFSKTLSQQTKHASNEMKPRKSMSADVSDASDINNGSGNNCTEEISFDSNVNSEQIVQPRKSVFPNNCNEESDIDITFTKSQESSKTKTSKIDSDISSFEKSLSFVQKRTKKSMFTRPVESEPHGSSLDSTKQKSTNETNFDATDAFDLEKTKSSQDYAKPRKTPLHAQTPNTSTNVSDILDMEKTITNNEEHEQSVANNTNTLEVMEECERDISSDSVYLNAHHQTHETLNLKPCPTLTRTKLSMNGEGIPEITLNQDEQYNSNLANDVSNNLVKNNTFSLLNHDTFLIDSANNSKENVIVEKQNETFTASHPVSSLDILPIISSGTYNTDNMPGCYQEPAEGSRVTSEENFNTSRRSTRSMSRSSPMVSANDINASSITAEDIANSSRTSIRLSQTIMSTVPAINTSSIIAEKTANSSRAMNTSIKESVLPGREKMDSVLEPPEENIDIARRSLRKRNTISHGQITTIQESGDGDKDESKKKNTTMPDLINSPDLSVYGNMSSLSNTGRRASVASIIHFTQVPEENIDKSQIPQGNINTSQIHEEDKETSEISDENMETSQMSEENVNTLHISQENVNMSQISEEDMDTYEILENMTNSQISQENANISRKMSTRLSQARISTSPKLSESKTNDEPIIIHNPSSFETSVNISKMSNENATTSRRNTRSSPGETAKLVDMISESNARKSSLSKQADIESDGPSSLSMLPTVSGDSHHTEEIPEVNHSVTLTNAQNTNKQTPKTAVVKKSKQDEVILSSDAIENTLEDENQGVMQPLELKQIQDLTRVGEKATPRRKTLAVMNNSAVSNTYRLTRSLTRSKKAKKQLDLRRKTIAFSNVSRSYDSMMMSNSSIDFSFDSYNGCSTRLSMGNKTRAVENKNNSETVQKESVVLDLKLTPEQTNKSEKIGLKKLVDLTSAKQTENIRRRATRTPVTNVSTIDETVQAAKREKRAALLFRSNLSLDNIPSSSTGSGDDEPKSSNSGDSSMNSPLISEDIGNTSGLRTRSSQAKSSESGDSSMNSSRISEDIGNTSGLRTRSSQAKSSKSGDSSMNSSRISEDIGNTSRTSTKLSHARSKTSNFRDSSIDSTSGDSSINSSRISEDIRNTSRRSTRSSHARSKTSSNSGDTSMDSTLISEDPANTSGLRTRSSQAKSAKSGDSSFNSTVTSEDTANTSRLGSRSSQSRMAKASSPVIEINKNTSVRESTPREQEKMDFISNTEENLNGSRRSSTRRSNNVSNEQMTDNQEVTDDKENEKVLSRAKKDLVNSLDETVSGNMRTGRRSSVTSGILKPPGRKSSLKSPHVSLLPNSISATSRSVSYNNSEDFSNLTSGSAYMTHSRDVCETIVVNSSDPSSSHSNQATSSVQNNSDNSTTQQVKRKKKRNLHSTSMLMENLTQETTNTSVKSNNVTFSARKTNLTQRTNKLLNDLSVQSSKNRALDFSTNSGGATATSDNSKFETFKQPLLPRRFSKVAFNESRAQSSSSTDGISLETPDLRESGDFSIPSSSHFFKHIDKNSTKISQFGTSTARKVKHVNEISTDATNSDFDKPSSSTSGPSFDISSIARDKTRSSTKSKSSFDISSIARDKTQSSTKSKSSLQEVPSKRSVSVSVEAAASQGTQRRSSIGRQSSVGRRSSVGLGYQTMDYAELSTDTHPEDSILRKILFTHDTSNDNVAEPVSAPTTRRRKPNDNMLDIVLDNGEIYKPKKLFTHKKAPWINKRLYEYLHSKLKTKYKLKTRLVSEYFAKLLYEKGDEIYRNGDIMYGHTPENKVVLEYLKNKMVGLGLIECDWEFFIFLKDYMPPPYGKCACAVLSTKHLFDNLEYVESEEEEEE